MDILVDVLHCGLGNLLVKAFNRVFGIKTAFREWGYVVIGFIFVASTLALMFFLIGV